MFRFLQDKYFNRRNSLLMALFFLVLTLGGVGQISRLDFLYDVERFFSPRDPELGYYSEYRDTFENDNTLILLAVESKDGVFNPAFLSRLDSAVDSLLQLPDMEYVTSPTRMFRFMTSPLGLPFRLPLLSLEDPDRIKADSARIYLEGNLVNSFFPADGRSVSILLKSRSHLSDDVHEGMLLGIDKVMKEQGFDDYHLGGRIIVENYYVKLIIRDMIFVSALTLLVMTVILWLIYKSPLGVLLPLLIMLVSAVLTLTLIQLTGGAINLMISMLPTILFVVSVGDSVHLINKYIYELRKGLGKPAALRVALQEVGLATFLTSLTTAVGFVSLVMMGIPPLKEFGIYVAIGVMLAYLVTVLLLPAMLFIIPGSGKFGTHEDKFQWHSRMDAFYSSIIRNRRRIALLSLLIIVLFVAGITRVRVNNHFLDDLSEHSTLKKDAQYFEVHYSGIRSLEVGMRVKDSTRTVFDPEVLNEMQRVEEFLLKEYGAGALWSPLSMARVVNQALHGGSFEHYDIPSDTRLLKKALASESVDMSQGLAQSFWTDDLRTARFSGRMHDVGSARASELNKKLRQFLDANTELVDYKVTGSMHLVDNNNQHLSVNLLMGLGLSLLVISVIVYLMFRSLRMALIALVPNVIPLILVAGMMGWIGIDLKVTTAMVFTIAFGVAVDNTIHILSRLRIERGKGKTFSEAVRYSYLTTGKSVVLTAIILILGFLCFLLAESKATYTIGLMISATLFVALWADLIVLPLLLRPWRRSEE